MKVTGTYKVVTNNRRLLSRLYSSTCTLTSNAGSGLNSFHLSDGRKPSYFQGPGSPKLVGLTMGQIIDAAPDRFGDAEAVVDRFHGIRKTFVQFKKEVDQVAMGFIALNLKKGDMIGIWSPNRYEWMLAQMATAKAGLIMATVNPAFQKPELEYILKKLELNAIIIPETFKTQNFYEMISDIVPEVKDSRTQKIKSKKYPHFTDLIMMTNKDFPGIFKFNDLYSAGGSEQKIKLDQLQKEIKFDDPVNLQFTSGTTGRPKAACLSHHNIINNSNAIAGRLGYYDQPHRIACSVPLFHCFGCVVGTSTTMLSGATCIFPAPSFDPEQILKTIEEEKCTSVYGTPTMYIDLLSHPNFKSTNVSSVITGLVAGASISPDLFERVMTAFSSPGFQIGYGSTELSPLITLQDHSESLAEKKDNVGSVAPNTEIKIVDPNDQLVPFGSPGEVCSRGYMVMKGYWGDLEKTHEAIIDGWFHTGDIGILSEDGRLRIIGRLKDMIIRGGENIYPKEIEDLLVTNSKILDAQVIGVPDERMGEEVCVWIQLKANETMTEAELKAFCKGQIAHFKIPKYIRFVNEFPKTVSGKIQKFVMRQEMDRILKEK